MFDTLPFWKQGMKHICHVPVRKAPNLTAVMECKLLNGHSPPGMEKWPCRELIAEASCTSAQEGSGKGALPPYLMLCRADF